MKPAPPLNIPPEKLLLDLGRSRNRAGIDKFLNRHPTLVQAEVVTRLAQIVVETIRKDTHLALSFAESGVLVAKRLRNRECTATAWRAKANALYGVGENRAAVKFHQQAIKSFIALRKWKEAARALSGSIQPLILLGKYEEAIAASERARAIYLRIGEIWRLARLEINVGNISHRQDRFEEALKCYERAYEGLLPHNDAEGLGIVLSNMAVCLVSLNDFDRALGTYEKARVVFQQNDMPLLVAQLDYNISYLYFLRGEYSHAIEMLFAAKHSFEKTGDMYHVSLCQLDLSEIYLELNLSEDAENMAREAYQHFRSLKTSYEAAKSSVNEAIALGRQGKAADALKQFKNAGKRFESEKNRIWPRLIELYQAVILYHEGRYPEAQRYCAGTVFFFDDVAMPGKAVLAHLLLARIALHGNQLEVASLHIEKALSRLKKIDSSEMECQAHFLRGQVAEARGDKQSTYAAYQEACRGLETLRSRLSGEDLKISFMKNRLEVYEKLVGLCLERGSGEDGKVEAFGYIEAAKSRNMTEIISQGGSRLSTSDDQRPELIQSVNKMRQNLNWYYHRIEIEQFGAEGFSPDRVDRLRKKAKALEIEFARSLRELPSSLRGTAVDVAPVHYPLEAIQESIDDDCTLLEYFCAGDQLVAAVVTRRDIQVIPVTQWRSVTELLHRLQFQLGKFRFGKNDSSQMGAPLLQAMQSALSSLCDHLIAPVRHFLNTGHLVIAPHSLLHYLPFHALRVADEYLGDIFTLSYAPSATVFSQCQQKPSKPIRSSLVMGIPDKLAPEIEFEVKAIAEILPAPKLFIGPSATVKVLREEGPKSELIHISTHGNFRQDNPMFSSIRLGDGPLNLYDLYQMRFDSTLVAFSGCSTGMNVIAPGDELLGLQRGLLYAGASSMLLSLWDVNDRSTSELMTAFYRRIMEVRKPALALQGAMQEIRSRYPHPYYWAPFIFVGKCTVDE